MSLVKLFSVESMGSVENMRTALKRATTFIMILASASLVACGQDDNSNHPAGGGTIVDVPTANACLSPGLSPGSAWPTNAWDSYRQYGFRNYNYGWYSNHNRWGNHYTPNGYGAYANNGFCGCPQGYMPVCNNGMGMACVPVSGIQNYPVALYQWNSGHNNFAFHGYNNWNNRTYANNGSCNNQYIGQACQIGTNSCGYGRSCRMVSPGSPMGVCVQY